MSKFRDRGKGFEAKFAHDEELNFKIAARRNKLLGLWAAELMGLMGDDATAYAVEVIKSDFEEAGDEDVYRKVKGDLDARGLDVSEHRVRREMEDKLALAREQVAGDS